MATPAAMALSPLFVILGSNLGIRYASTTAELYLKRGVPLSRSAGRLVVSDPALKTELLPALKTAAEPPDMDGLPMPRPWVEWHDPASEACHLYRLTSLRLPLSRSEHCQWLAGLFIDAPGFRHDPVEAYAARHRLSRTEARLLALLVAGHSLNDSATRLGQRISTTRTVLKKVFCKTDTHRQAELIASVLRDSGTVAVG